MKLLPFLLPLTIAVAYPSPGLLRVPKVYNALVTSNQNLSPSRAFPVLQPVVHTTAFGYVPPFYYTQFAPHYPGPEVGRVPQEFLPAVSAGRSETELPKDSKENGAVANGAMDLAKPEARPTEKTEGAPPEAKDEKRKDGTGFPLSFYPNYQTLYHDPYFYSYNGFDSHFAPNPYFYDYQQAALAPLPALPHHQDGFSDHLLPRFSEEKPDTKEEISQDQIPDVPPPPVPTGVPKQS